MKKYEGPLNKVSSDTSLMKYYNYQKLGHYSNKCQKPKTSLDLSNLLVGDWD